MGNARLEIAFGPDFSESRTLTWKHDGLVILPTGKEWMLCLCRLKMRLPARL